MNFYILVILVIMCWLSSLTFFCKYSRSMYDCSSTSIRYCQDWAVQFFVTDIHIRVHLWCIFSPKLSLYFELDSHVYCKHGDAQNSTFLSQKHPAAASQHQEGITLSEHAKWCITNPKNAGNFQQLNKIKNSQSI